MNPPTALASGQGTAAPAQDAIRLMIVDDSPIARAVLSRMLSAYREFEIVALAANSGEAIDALKSVKVDIVLLDVEMPGTNGLQVLPDILKYGDGARVIIVSSLCEDGAEATVRALALGAADTLPKPGAGTFGGSFAQVLAERLRRIGRTNRHRPVPDMPPPSGGMVPMRLRDMPDGKLACLAIGASTGGLYALTDFLRALPDRIDAPILVTQHLPALFIPFFARQIGSASGRRVSVAEDDLALRPEEIVVAPGDAHLGLERRGKDIVVKLSRAPVATGCLPSVDPMLSAVAEIYGHSAIGIILSGMGRDGLLGSSRLVDRGGAVLVQNQQTSAVWGMPRAVAEAGLASAILPPSDLARRIAARVSGGGAWK